MADTLEENENPSMHPGIYTHTQTSKHTFKCLDSMSVKSASESIQMYIAKTENSCNIKPKKPPEDFFLLQNTL